MLLDSIVGTILFLLITNVPLFILMNDVPIQLMLGNVVYRTVTVVGVAGWWALNFWIYLRKKYK